MPYFDEPVGRVKIQTTSKNILRCYTPKHLISDLLSKDYSFRALFVLYEAELDNKYRLLTKCEVKMTGYWPSSLFLCV